VTWAGLVLVPTLAVAAVGPGLLPALVTGTSEVQAPGGLLVAETRAFSTLGDDVAALYGVKPSQPSGEGDDGVAALANIQFAIQPAGTVDEFMDTWKNTVARRISRRR
jgi:hypothetical protein